MQKIMIMSDSACDLSKETIEELGIKVVPLKITFGDTTYRETFDKTTQEIYEMMENFSEIPKTSAVNAYEFEEAYKEIYDQGYTDIVYVGINAKGSATFNNSLMAKESFFENNPEAKGKIRIFNVDSKCYTGVYGYPIKEAVKKIKKGTTAEELVAYFEEWFDSVSVYVVPLTLKYAKKSGRISAAAAFAGEMLGLKPLIEFRDGTTTTLEKIRGEKNIVSKVVACLEKNMVPQSPYVLVCGKDDTLSREIEKELYKKFGRKAEDCFAVGAAVAANIGVEFCGVICRKKSVQ